MVGRRFVGMVATLAAVAPISSLATAAPANRKPCRSWDQSAQARWMRAVLTRAWIR